MKPLTNGCVIREYGYGTYIDSTITSDVTYNEKGQDIFTSETAEGKEVNYQKNPASLEVLSYPPCRDCDGSGLFYQIEDCKCHCQDEK